MRSDQILFRFGKISLGTKCIFFFHPTTALHRFSEDPLLRLATFFDALNQSLKVDLYATACIERQNISLSDLDCCFLPAARMNDNEIFLPLFRCLAEQNTA